MKRKIGINCDCVQGIDSLDALELIKTVGFDCFFTGSELTDFDKIARIKEKGDKLGLSYEFIHAPFKNVNSMWNEDENTKPFMKSIFQSIDNASGNGVPAIILHASSGWNYPTITDEGFARYDELVAYGESKKVIIAFENMRTAPNYTALLERYKNNPYARYCYDNGHEHCWAPEVPHIEKYGDRMCCTHLHDNFGKLENYLSVDGDLHLLPFDGNFDYESMICRMDQCGYTGSLTLEVFNDKKAEYMALSAEDFFRTAYERLKKISEM